MYKFEIDSYRFKLNRCKFWSQIKHYRCASNHFCLKYALLYYIYIKKNLHASSVML